MQDTIPYNRHVKKPVVDGRKEVVEATKKMKSFRPRPRIGHRPIDLVLCPAGQQLPVDYGHTDGVQALSAKGAEVQKKKKVPGTEGNQVM